MLGFEKKYTPPDKDGALYYAVFALIFAAVLWITFAEQSKTAKDVPFDTLAQSKGKFWAVDKRYYVTTPPEDAENNEKWQSFMAWQRRALDYDPDAFMLLGTAYYLGTPVEQDLKAAAYWFKIAADQNGRADGMYNYALVMSETGNRDAYAKYVIAAAEKGSNEARNDIARSVLSRQSEQAAQVFATGKQYAKLSAESGSKPGILLYANYLYREKDRLSAVWLSKLEGVNEIDLIHDGVNPLEVGHLRYDIIANLFGGDPALYAGYMTENGATPKLHESAAPLTAAPASGDVSHHPVPTK